MSAATFPALCTPGNRKKTALRCYGSWGGGGGTEEMFDCCPTPPLSCEVSREAGGRKGKRAWWAGHSGHMKTWEPPETLLHPSPLGTNYAASTVPVSAFSCPKLLRAFSCGARGQQACWLCCVPCDPPGPTARPRAPLDAKTLFFQRHLYDAQGLQQVWQ